MDYKQEIEILRRQNDELIRSRLEVLQELSTANKGWQATLNTASDLKRENDQLQAITEQQHKANGALVVRIGDVCNENDQLQARVAELEEFIECNPDSPFCEEILNRQPAQSLASHDARVLRELLTKLGLRRSRTLSVSKTLAFIAEEADRIKKEGEV